MTQERNYITPQGLAKIKEEYDFLLLKERPKLVETIAWAASNGDRSENADYIYGKRRLREIDRRLYHLQKKIESAIVVDPQIIVTNQVVFGAWVLLENQEGEFIRYQIVGEDEFDIPKGLISWKSPVAKALLGKKVNDQIIVKTPKGDVEYEILKIAKSRQELELE